MVIAEPPQSDEQPQHSSTGRAEGARDLYFHGEAVFLGWEIPVSERDLGL